MMDGQPTNIHEAINDLCHQANVEATNPTVQLDFVYELVKQYPLLLLQYVAEQSPMEITATSTVRFS